VTKMVSETYNICIDRTEYHTYFLDYCTRIREQFVDLDDKYIFLKFLSFNIRGGLFIPKNGDVLSLKRQGCIVIRRNELRTHFPGDASSDFFK
jgi:hypothetical protein